MYASVLEFFNKGLIVLMCISAVLLSVKIMYHIIAFTPPKRFANAKTKHMFAILIPARYESAVIKDLLNSLENQDYPKQLFDTYVIVESESDPTCEIVKNYSNVSLFVRPNLDVKTKGGALDQIIKHLLNNGVAVEKNYEAYFIIDADNTVNPSFLTEMNKCYDAGFEVGISYHHPKNWNDGWVASCSALTFSMINTFQNKARSKLTNNIVISGTGYYISARVINNLGGWPFQTLTEDVELSNYCVLNSIKTTYNEFAEHFDELPLTLAVSFKQRIRWLKGHLQATHIYSGQLLKSVFTKSDNIFGRAEFAFNVLPVAIPLAGILGYAIAMFVMGIIGTITHVDKMLCLLSFKCFGKAILGLYLFFIVYTVMLLINEYIFHKIELELKNAIIASLMNPFFLGLYIPIALIALFKKNITWKPIDRKATLKTEECELKQIDDLSSTDPNTQTN